MRAAFFSGPRHFDLREVPRPRPGAGDVLVNVHACGVCGSDLHFYTGQVRTPRVCPGHEICGTVAADSDTLAAGTPVAVEPIRVCGRCPPCLAGDTNLCRRLVILGQGAPGGFAEALLVPAGSVHPLPAGLDLDTAVLAEPLAVAVHGVALGGVTEGDEVLVLGAGVIGLLTAFVALGAGARVVVSARHPQQRAAAGALGVEVVAAEPEAIASRAAARPPAVVFETVGGDAATFDLAIDSVRPAGRIVVLGVFTRPLVVPPLRLLAKEVRIVPSMMYGRRPPRPDFALALDLLRAHRALAGAFVTHRVPLGDIDRGFALAADKRSGAIKVAITVA